MTIQWQPAEYSPDIDGGTIADMSGFAPLERGVYGSAAKFATFTLPSGYSDVRRAAVFRFTATGDTGGNGTEQVYLFRNLKASRYSPIKGSWEDIGTSLALMPQSSTWGVAQWGDYVILCARSMATKYSIAGQTFNNLPGSPPKAALAASNVNFVMLGNIDVGGTVTEDEVFWSALQNPEDWTPSIATQCGRYRFLDTPGPLTALMAYKDTMLAFKSSSMYVGEYVGPPFVWAWRLVSEQIGVAQWQPHICALDDKVYFVHTSGIWQWDGAQLQNISRPVWSTIRSQLGVAVEKRSTVPGSKPYPPTGYSNVNGYSLALMRLVPDPIEGVLWVTAPLQNYTTGFWRDYFWGCNVRTGKWAALGWMKDAAGSPVVPIEGKHDVLQTVFPYDSQARFFYCNNIGGTERILSVGYPKPWSTITTPITAHIDTVTVGSPNASSDMLGVAMRTVNGSDAQCFESSTFYGYANESMTLGAESEVATYNSEFGRWDAYLRTRYKMARMVGLDGKYCLLAGIGIDTQQATAR
jgi:hypothetical protein